MLTEFNKLYETGEFQLGDCLADVQVKEKGTVDSVRVVRPQNVDKRVESAIVRSMKSRRYTPATHVNVLFPSRCQSASAIAHPERNATAGRIDNEAGRRAHRPLPSRVERLQGCRVPQVRTTPLLESEPPSCLRRTNIVVFRRNGARALVRNYESTKALSRLRTGSVGPFGRAEPSAR